MYIEWYHYQWPWVTFDPGFKVTTFSKLGISETTRCRGIVLSGCCPHYIYIYINMKICSFWVYIYTHSFLGLFREKINVVFISGRLPQGTVIPGLANVTLQNWVLSRQRIFTTTQNDGAVKYIVNLFRTCIYIYLLTYSLAYLSTWIYVHVTLV